MKHKGRKIKIDSGDIFGVIVVGVCAWGGYTVAKRKYTKVGM